MSKDYMTAMSLIKCNGATAPVPIPIQCPISHGVISCKTHFPVLNANDYIPLTNILTFGTCKMIPPTPAGPVPCVPAIVMPWKKGDTHYTIAGAAVLTKDSFVTCTFGGTIKFQ